MLDLVGYLYEAVADETLWPGLASRILAVFKADGTALMIVGDSLAVVARTPDVDDHLVREYQMLLGAQCRGRNEASDREVASRDWANSDWESSLVELAPQRASFGACPSWRGIGSLVPIAPGHTAIFGMHRDASGPVFGIDDKARLSEFLPHLCRALRLCRQLKARLPAADPITEQLDWSPVATIIASADGQIVHLNRAAAACLGRNDGIHSIHGRLAGQTRAATDRLRRAISRAGGDAATGQPGTANALSLPREGGPGLTVLVEPHRRPGTARDERGPAAILFIRDPGASALSCTALQSLFGLTASEAAIASALAAGKAPEEIAAGSNIALNTVRAHLKSVFSKTGTRRQAQLVAMLLCSVAPLAAP
jgi:DNA-binding CsgD family transcriptional regulator